MTSPEGTATFVTNAETGQLVERVWRVEVLEGVDRGKGVRRKTGTILVGTKGDNDLELSDPGVSRYHLELRVFPELIEVRELGSKNGTRIGGLPIERAFAPPGAKVRLGNTTLGFAAEDAPSNVGEGLGQFGEFITSAPRMQKILAELDAVARSEVTVLLEGDTGTGKELLARAIHDASPRSGGPFIILDCASIQPSLLSSQLFGHVEGAFTGAMADRAGAFERAHGGTLFLDEVGELPLDLQPSLLRALETRTVSRVGGHEPRRVDVRFVAATHRRLGQMVQSKTFRADLYYRLAVVLERILPLSERPEDVPLLARRLTTDLGAAPEAITPQITALLTAYDWPGNVRELRNAIERGVALARGRALRAEHFFWDEAGAPPYDAAFAEFERRYVQTLLARHEGNVSRAARSAGLSRGGLYKMMKRSGAG